MKRIARRRSFGTISHDELPRSSDVQNPLAFRLQGAFAVVAVLLAVGLPARAQVGQVQSAQGNSGQRMTNGVVAGVTLAGQAAIGLNQSPDGTLRNYAGFVLAAALLRPTLDHDGDGLCDEMDADNDNDGLDDATEILGTAFVPCEATDPNQADSDADGMNDGDEAVAGTCAVDSNSVLAITGILWDGHGIKVDWKGGTLARQYLQRRENLGATNNPWVDIFTNEPPTQSAVSVTDAGAAAPVFYRIRVERP